MKKYLNARTPLGSDYFSSRNWESQLKGLSRSWHVYPGELPDDDVLRPWTLLPGSMDEPLLLSGRGQDLKCMSNVCTHRGALLVEKECPARGIRCCYHGRRFDTSGKMISAPGFENAPNFPDRSCDLPKPVFKQRHGMGFVNLSHRVVPRATSDSFDSWWKPLERIDFLLQRPMKFYQKKDFDVSAHWALYCENYLEGLHIPYVHHGLSKSLNMGEYAYEMLPEGILQLGISDKPENCFDIPKGHQDEGRNIAAYYYFLFPCTMINVYPWGISVNSIQPQTINQTRVTFFSLVADNSLLTSGVGAGLGTVEIEDEAVVESVAKGLKSRLYKGGRYAPEHEESIYHFHQLMSKRMPSSNMRFSWQDVIYD